MNKQHTPLEVLRNAFRVYNQTTAKSGATVRWYDDRLMLFERFVGVGATLADVNVATVREYVADLLFTDDVAQDMVEAFIAG
jgi:hypothetical protein